MIAPRNPAIILIALLSTCLSWTFSSTNINLSYPPPLQWGYGAENNKAVGPDVLFPCATVPVNPSESRVPFPISGGAFTYNLTNSTVGSLSEYEYILDIYLGQISLGDGTYSTSNTSLPSADAGFTYADTEVFKDFSSGQQCSNEFDAVELINQALGTNHTAADVVGMNATFGVRLILFAPNPLITYEPVDDYTQEEMYQCGYVTFTNPDPSTLSGSSGYCNLGSSLPPVSASPSPSRTTTQVSLSSGTIIDLPPTTWSTLYTSTVTTTTSAYSTTTSSFAAATGVLGAGSTSHPVTHTVVGAGVGVSMGASLLVLAIGFVLLRRRRASKARSGTVGAHVLVDPAVNDQEMKSIKKQKAKFEEEGAESSGSSVHSEPLPVYTETVKGP